MSDDRKRKLDELAAKKKAAAVSNKGKEEKPAKSAKSAPAKVEKKQQAPDKKVSKERWELTL